MPGTAQREPVVLLHGFGGTHRAWDAVVERLAARPLALDLPGHGAASAVRPITFGACVSHVLDAVPGLFSLCGYSLGGRVALHVALGAPERVRSLVLVSCSAGIEDQAERARRREADGELAAALEREPFEDFIERWRTQPLFAGEPAAVGELARADQRRNDPHALAAAMRGIGAGEMEPLWERLEELEMPVTIVVGERDAEYRAIGERMAARIGAVALVVLPGGHRLPLESPGALAAVLAS